ncbi:MAG: TIM barrel protein [Candidatus Poribacteria bacterium]
MPEVERLNRDYEHLKEQLRRGNIDIENITNALMCLEIETPSWGYGRGGTRFGRFVDGNEPTDIFGKLEEAAKVNRLTGIAPSVAIHIPWDKVDDYNKILDKADHLGLRIGAINPNLFEDQDYKYGSLTNTNPDIRRKAVDHILECIEIGKIFNSKILSLWLSDGTNYPGQGDFRDRKEWIEESLSEVYENLPDYMRLLIEYKFFEPAFYHTDIFSFGIALDLAKKLGSKAQVLVDLGHHPRGTNIPHIVAYLLSESKLGGFHLNDAKYADDDLTTSSIDPYQLFLIFVELTDPRSDTSELAYMIDQSHNEKNPTEAMIQTLENLQHIYAKSLLVDREKLKNAQMTNDTIEAEETLIKAFRIDVTPIVKMARHRKGLPLSPLNELRK